MKGYKGMDKDMKCRGMQFEVGKTYQVEGDIELCKRGLHFCQNLKDVFDFYERTEGNRFFEVVTDKTIKSDGRKSVTSELTIVRELSSLEVNKTTYGDGYGYGYGNGYGYGYGNGYGNGYGYGDGNGNGYGNGYGNIQKIAQFKD